MRQTIGFTEYTNNDEIVHQLPARFELCPACDGCETDRGASVECDGGGFTSSEWAEQNEDFREDYLAGRYDRPCEHCRRHVGRILTVDRAACKPELLALYDAGLKEEAEYRNMCAAERRMGC
jgi:hypothetical protein